MKRIFFNEHENRLRAGWRITIVTFLLILSVILSSFLTPYKISYSLLLALLMLAVLWTASGSLDHRPFSEFGFRFSQKWLKEFFIGNAMAALAIAGIVCIQLAMGWMEYKSIQQPELDRAVTGGLIYWVLMMAGVSVWEEAYFRSYLITNLRDGFQFNVTGNRGAILIAVLISSLAFGILHLGNPNSTWISTINIAIAGMVLAYPYIVTKSVAISVGMHLSWNYFQGAVFGLPVSGQPFDQSLMIAHVSGPIAFTGGSFGPEAGAAGLLGLMILLVLSEIYFVFFYQT